MTKVGRKQQQADEKRSAGRINLSIKYTQEESAKRAKQRTTTRGCLKIGVIDVDVGCDGVDAFIWMDDGWPHGMVWG